MARGRQRFAVLLLALGLTAPAGAQAPAVPAGPWRSALYPEDWAPGFADGKGRFLHDFSWAGYRHGEDPGPEVAGPVRDAAREFGADPRGERDATAALQAAIEAVSAHGGVVWLPAGTYRCDGRLRVAASRVVLRGAGAERTRVWFATAEPMSDRAALTFAGRLEHGPDVPLARDGENGASVVQVADARDLAAGDDVALGWTISAEFVADHGMTGVWQAFVGQWKPVFRRRVVAIDRTRAPHAVTLDVPLRYPARTRDHAGLRRETGWLSEVGVESLAVSTATPPARAWADLRSHAIRLEGVADGFVRGVASFAAPLPEAGGDHLRNCGILVVSSKCVTIADCRLERAQNRGPGGCGYLFEVSRSNEVLIRDCVGLRGRHNFIQNWDFGTTGCVFLRVRSAEGRVLASARDATGLPGLSEYHHSLAMANLVDQSELADGFFAGNRLTMSSGAGHTSTQCVFWNLRGSGVLLSWQYGHGYVIGTEGLSVTTGPGNPFASRTGPEDWREGVDAGARLQPPSLYEDQRARRLGRERR